MRSSSLCVRHIMLASTAAVLAYAAPAAAQDASPADVADTGATTGLEEIVVTARKRAETMMDVPVAVSALSAKDITRYAATDLSKIGQMVPQVIIAKTGGGGSGASFAIRGVGSSALDAGIEQTVSVNIDGLQVSRGRIATQGFFDIQQVEVLKGPQALFFGKNSPGGVISVTSAAPTDTLEAFVRGGYEFKADERFIEGAISGPLTDTLRARLAVKGTEMSGYIKNVAGPLFNPDDPAFPRPGAARGRTPHNKELLGRLTLEWQPTDSFDATLKVFGSTLEDSGETSGVENKCTTVNGTALLNTGGLLDDPYGDCKLDGRRSSTALPEGRAENYPGSGDGSPFTKYKSVLTSLTMNYEFNDVNFTSVTGFYDYSNRSFDNFDYTAGGLVWGYNVDKTQTITQEIRAASDFGGPLNFVVGGLYEHMKRNTRGNGQLFNLGLDPVTGNYNNWALLSANKGNTWSFFGQLIWDITDNVELAGGARWTNERKTASVGHEYLNPVLPGLVGAVPQGVFLAGDYDDTNVSPEATLSWHPTSRSTIYVAYKTGYKSGGFSNPASLFGNPTIDTLRFGAEKAEGGEIGAKGTFFDNMLAVNFAMYRYKFDDLQLTSFNANDASFTIRNAASARTTGAELDASLAVSQELTLRGAVGYNKAKYLTFAGAPCYAGQTAGQGCVGGVQDLSGTPLVRAPKWSLSGGLTYDRELNDALMFGLSTDANYTSGYWMQENQNPVGWQKGFARLNASVRVYEPDNKWELALIGRNLTNKYYGVASNDKPLGYTDNVVVSIGRPREILLQATYRFR